MWNIKKFISKGDYYYALVPEHPNATKHGYVLAHRVIIENHLGRILNKNEVVHHKDGNKKNNNIDNLEVLDIVKHSRMHSNKHGHQMVKLKCPWCKKVFDIPRNKSFLVHINKFNCTCCSPSCRGKFTRFIQLNGLTPTMKNAISENLLACYIKYNDEDNSEETNL